MDYFNLFNKIIVNNIKLTDITNLIVIKTDIKDYLIPYTFKDGETVFDAANTIYGDDKLYWIIYLNNPELFQDPLKSTEELNEILRNEYSVNVYKLKELNYNYLNGNYEWVHETANGQFPIKEFDSTRDLVITNSNESGVIKLIFGNNVIIPDQQEYVYREAPKYYKYREILLNKIPDNTLIPLDELEIITFEDDLQNENEKKRIINVINPKYKDDLISNILEKVNQ